MTEQEIETSGMYVSVFVIDNFFPLWDTLDTVWYPAARRIKKKDC
jgi:hypothetical protein